MKLKKLSKGSLRGERALIKDSEHILFEILDQKPYKWPPMQPSLDRAGSAELPSWPFL